MPKQKELTPQQREFVKEYVTNGRNAQKAAIAAGYSASYAKNRTTTLLSNEFVEEAILRYSHRAAVDVDLTVSKILNGILRNANDAHADGKFSDSNKSWELLGKYMGLFNEKAQLDLTSSDGTVASPGVVYILPDNNRSYLKPSCKEENVEAKDG